MTDMWDLLGAINSNDLHRAQTILKRNPSTVNDWNLDFKTPLHVVCGTRDNVENRRVQANHLLPMMDLLLDFEADVNARTGDYGNETALHIAVRNDQLEMVKLLLERKADPNAKDVEEKTVIYLAATLENANEGIVKLLLQYGADPLDVNKNIVYINMNIWEILVKAGAKIFNVYREISLACSEKNVNVMKYLLKHSAELDFNGRFSCDNLIYCMSSYNNINYSSIFLLKMMLESGVDLNVQQSESRAGLHVVVDREDYCFVEQLLMAGVNVNVTNRFKETPLHILLKKQKQNNGSQFMLIAKLLIEYGARINDKNVFGETQLELAVKNDHINVINMILVNITGVDRSTLKCYMIPDILKYSTKNFDEFSVAIALGYESVVDCMLDIGYNTEIQQYLDFAFATNQYNMIKMILETGFQKNRRYYSLCLPEDRLLNLRLVSLLWVFFDTTILKSTLLRVLYVDCECEKKDDLFNLLLFCYAIDSYLNNLSPDFIPLKGIFKLNRKLSLLLDSYFDKLEELKEIKVCGDVTMFGMLTIKFNWLVNLMNYGDNFQACSNLHSMLENKQKRDTYEILVFERIGLAMEKSNALNCARDCLDDAFEGALENTNHSSLPEEIMSNILSYLSTRELKKFSYPQRSNNENDMKENVLENIIK